MVVSMMISVLIIFFVYTNKWDCCKLF